MKKNLAVIMVVFALTVAALAHGKHILGTVKAIAPTKITISTPDGQTQTVAIGPETQFTNSGAKASVHDLKVGDRVAVHAVEKGDSLFAAEIRFGRQGMRGAAH